MALDETTANRPGLMQRVRNAIGNIGNLIHLGGHAGRGTGAGSGEENVGGFSGIDQLPSLKNPNDKGEFDLPQSSRFLDEDYTEAEEEDDSAEFAVFYNSDDVEVVGQSGAPTGRVTAATQNVSAPPGHLWDTFDTWVSISDLMTAATCLLCSLSAHKRTFLSLTHS
jgi:hypothetical protein